MTAHHERHRVSEPVRVYTNRDEHETLSADAHRALRLIGLVDPGSERAPDVGCGCAVEDWLAKHTDQSFSLCNAVSFAS